MYCSEVTFDINKPRTLLFHLASCPDASFGVQCQFELEELAVSTVISIEPISPTDTPVLIADSPDIQLPSQDGDGEVFDCSPRIQSPGLRIMNPRSERSLETSRADNRVLSPSIDVRMMHPLGNDMMMSAEEMGGEWLEETEEDPSHGKDSGLGLSTGSSSGDVNTVSSDGLFMRGDDLGGMDADATRTSSREMTVVTVKEEPADEATSPRNDHQSMSQEAEVGQTIIDQEQEVATQALARAICVTGSSFDISRNKFFEKFINAINPDYYPPHPNLVLDYLITKEHSRIEEGVQEKLANAPYVALYVTGWKDPRQDMVQYVVLTPEPVYFAAHQKMDSAHKEVDMDSPDFHLKVVHHLVDVIEKIGPTKIVVLITDIDLSKDLPYDHILKVKCPLVALEDALSDAISHFPTLEEMLREAKHVCGEIMSAPETEGQDVRILDEVLRFKEKYEVDIATFICQLRRLRNIVPRLQERGKWFRGSEMSRNRERLNTIYHRPGEFREEAMVILDKVSDVVHMLTHSPPMLYELKPLMDDLVQSIANHGHSDETFNNFKEILTNGILSCIEPVHCAAYMLRPLDKRKPPVSSNIIKANQVITTIATHLGLEVGRVMASLAEFRAQQGIWGDSSVWMSTKYISPLTWWKGLCSSEPISNVACRLMCLPVTLARNRLIPKVSNHLAQYGALSEDTVARLAFVRGNLHFSTWM